MKTEDLNYNLPEELIAQKPADKRSESKLLVLDKSNNTIEDKVFHEILDYVKPGDCFVINDTKVLAARFFAKRDSGAKLEGLFLSLTSDGSWNVMIKNSRKIKEGENFVILDREKEEYCKAKAEIKNEDGTWDIIPESNKDAESILDEVGFAPLPPYIKRPEGGETPDEDLKRYQTVFAEQYGAVAAPTAGLHFTEDILKQISRKGAFIARVTLHVGAGTFKPVTSENVEDHEIHSERFSINAENANLIKQCKQLGGRIIAVGTTSVRTLETIASHGELEACSGETKLFITPGFEFKLIDAMVTNFHLPKSTLIALVGSFAGMDNIMNAYKHAVEEKYRFFSFGDAMLII